MTLRDDILDAVRVVMARTGSDVFSVRDIVAELQSRETPYTAGSIRTHVVSRMCANAPAHHARVYNDLVRVDRGLYKLRR
jgi:hypothetical protein